MVRPLRAGEHDAIRELRLRALQDAPWAFAMTYEQEVADPPERWEWLAGQSEKGLALTVFVADDFDGMAGVYIEADKAYVWGMWVDPRARGKGLAGELLRAAVEWARERGAARVELTVSDRAQAAAALYARLGFEPTGEKMPLAANPEIVETVLSLRL